MLSPEECYKLWRAICRPKIARLKANRWQLLEELTFNTLLNMGYRAFSGRVRYLQGASGIDYQNDVLVYKPEAPGQFLLVECKVRGPGSVTSKEDVMVFNSRAIDIFMRYTTLGIKRSIFRVFVSSVPLDRNAFRYCLTYGILVIQPKQSNNTYEVTLSLRPPVQAIIYRLKTFDSSRTNPAVKRLINRARSLQNSTFREVAPVRPWQIWDGVRLERSYLDLVYMSNAAIEGRWD